MMKKATKDSSLAGTMAAFKKIASFVAPTFLNRYFMRVPFCLNLQLEHISHRKLELYEGSKLTSSIATHFGFSVYFQMSSIKFGFFVAVVVVMLLFYVLSLKILMGGKHVLMERYNRNSILTKGDNVVQE